MEQSLLNKTCESYLSLFQRQRSDLKLFHRQHEINSLKFAVVKLKHSESMAKLLHLLNDNGFNELSLVKSLKNPANISTDVTLTDQATQTSGQTETHVVNHDHQLNPDDPYNSKYQSMDNMNKKTGTFTDANLKPCSPLKPQHDYAVATLPTISSALLSTLAANPLFSLPLYPVVGKLHNSSINQAKSKDGCHGNFPGIQPCSLPQYFQINKQTSFRSTMLPLVQNVMEEISSSTVKHAFSHCAPDYTFHLQQQKHQNSEHLKHQHSRKQHLYKRRPCSNFPYHCVEKICDENLMNSADLSSSAIVTLHPRGKRPTVHTDPAQYIRCKLCKNKILGNRVSNLMNHVRRHSTVKQFQCVYCDYVHNEMAKVRLHMSHNHADADSQPIDNITKEMQICWSVLMQKCFPQHCRRYISMPDNENQ